MMNRLASLCQVCKGRKSVIVGRTGWMVGRWKQDIPTDLRL
jgi:hypothetical protein